MGSLHYFLLCTANTRRLALAIVAVGVWLECSYRNVCIDTFIKLISVAIAQHYLTQCVTTAGLNVAMAEKMTAGEDEAYLYSVL